MSLGVSVGSFRMLSVKSFVVKDWDSSDHVPGRRSSSGAD
jgi:hypothetical protein